MTQTTEQERELKDIEQALRLVREAHQHEVDAYRQELYKPEGDRKPKDQLHRLGDLICLLQNILYAAQQASRRAQVVPQGYEHGMQSGNRVILDFDTQANADAWFEQFCDSYDAATPQPQEAAHVQMPEPISKVLEDCRSRAIDYATCPSPYNRECMETAFQRLEHQVRQLLAATPPRSMPPWTKTTD